MARVCVISVLLFICRASRAFLWSASVQDLAELYACVGDTVTLPWNFTLAEGESVEDIKWHYQQEDSARQSVAATVDGTFFPLPAFAHRVDHLAPAGIRLHNVTDVDTGNYSVVVTVLRGTTFTTFQHSLILTVAANPLVAMRGSQLTLHQQRVAVYSNATGQFHVQLTCGSFQITGDPPVAVELTHPSGRKDVVSEHDRGNFSLLLPNPVEGGNYVCRLLAVYPPVSCLPATSNVLSSVTVSIDEVRARMSLIEAEQRALQEENARLTKQNSYLQSTFLNSQLVLLQQTTDLSAGLLEFRRAAAAGRVSFHAQLSSTRNVSVSSTAAVDFDNIINNVGGAYQSYNGRFIAPVNGTYFFIATCVAASSDVTFVIETSSQGKLCQARAFYGRLSSDSYSRQWAATCHASAHLSRGSWVRVRTETSATLFSSYNSFSGFTVSVDP